MGACSGNIYRFDLKYLVEYFELQPAKGVYERMNYNPNRNAKEDYVSQLEKNKREVFSVSNYLKCNFQQVLLGRLNSNYKISRLEAAEEQVQRLEAQHPLHEDNRIGRKAAGDEHDRWSFKVIKSIVLKSFRIFNLQGELKGALNINHPLPLVWNISFSKKDENKKKLIYAFKIIDII